MRIGWIDAKAGATGDMWLGALVGAGASLEAIERGVQTLGIGEVRVSYANVRRGGRAAVSVRVRPPAETPAVATVAQVRALLEFSAIDVAVRKRTLAVFDRLATATAEVDGTNIDEVRFHEVAMLDDLAAIVGASIGIEQLAVDQWLAGAVGVPAGRALEAVTARLLVDHRTRPHDTEEAIVSPVGAALLATLTTDVAQPPVLTIVAEGSGAASRDLSDAGLLHLVVGVPVDDEDRAPVARPRSI